MTASGTVARAAAEPQLLNGPRPGRPLSLHRLAGGVKSTASERPTECRTVTDCLAESDIMIFPTVSFWQLNSEVHKTARTEPLPRPSMSR